MSNDLFDKQSRYARLESYEVTDHRGRTVNVTPVPPATDPVSRGSHPRKPGQRLDHIAHRFLNAPAGFWRLCDLNNTMLPEALTEARTVDIPETSSP